jgi:hypothetical protein
MLRYEEYYKSRSEFCIGTFLPREESSGRVGRRTESRRGEGSGALDQPASASTVVSRKTGMWP